jgi:hypothetical protein
MFTSLLWDIHCTQLANHLYRFGDNPQAPVLKIDQLQSRDFGQLLVG